MRGRELNSSELGGNVTIDVDLVGAASLVSARFNGSPITLMAGALTRLMLLLLPRVHTAFRLSLPMPLVIK